MKTFIKNLVMFLISVIAGYVSTPPETGFNWLYLFIFVLGNAVLYTGKNYLFPSMSVLGTIDIRDAISGLIMAIGSGILSFAGSIITTHTIDWKSFGMAVFTAGVGYLASKFGFNSQGQLLKKEPVNA